MGNNGLSLGTCFSDAIVKFCKDGTIRWVHDNQCMTTESAMGSGDVTHKPCDFAGSLLP